MVFLICVIIFALTLLQWHIEWPTK